uniref:Transcription factor bHLH140 n=1 Tax=Populus alba TaxID=43335 RepID=A0A4U5MA27_POPAL|nr:transcription factor bHLH140 [Populus alba]
MAVDHQKIDTDIDNKGEEQQKGKPVMVILVGAPGSGKSTFCEHVMGSSLRPWTRICQDTINNGKAGTKPQCLKRAAAALKEGKSLFIDRCNLDKEQRSDFVKLDCGAQVDVHAVVLDLPAQLCISRSVKRTGHEGNLQGGKAAAVVNRMLQKKELPKLNEGFARIKNPDAKIQLGIMKFLKKVEAPSSLGSCSDSVQDSACPQASNANNTCCKGTTKQSLLLGAASKEVKESEDMAKGSVDADVSAGDITTLAFPSISTADFQFNNEKASDIIVEKVEEFVNKLENARLVLVDLSHGSKILSLVRAKAAKKEH